MYEIGYDTVGREVVLNDSGDYVTHIPNNLSIDEVLRRLYSGIAVNFDPRNQGMQNIPACQVDESVPVDIAPRDEWPVFKAWREHWLTCIDCLHQHCQITFDEFREQYLRENPPITLG